MTDWGETYKCPECGRRKFRHLKDGRKKCYGNKCGYVEVEL